MNFFAMIFIAASVAPMIIKLLATSELSGQLVIAIVSTALASSGFWALIQNALNKKSAKTQMLTGLAHDRIMSLAMYYLSRGDWITRDEYENLHNYLYIPYKKLGGNGSADRVMEEINHKLRIVDFPPEDYIKTHRDL